MPADWISIGEEWSLATVIPSKGAAGRTTLRQVAQDF
jgi:hypothetical protein